MPTNITSPNAGFDFYTGIGFIKTTGELVVRIPDAVHTSVSGGFYAATPGVQTWHHFAATFNDLNDTLTIYYDGAQDASATLTGALYGPSVNSYIGGVQDAPASGDPVLAEANHFSGHIAEARFFDYPINLPEMLTLVDNRNFAPLVQNI